MVVSNQTTKASFIDPWLDLLRQHRAIAVIRNDNFALAYQMAHTVAAAGMNSIEITWNCDRPGELISRLSQELPHCTIGAGTILQLDELAAAVEAGAQFAFSPCFDAKLQAASNYYQLPFVPGIFTPTEAVNAWRQGAKVVKVFPIKSLGGATYIKCLQGPLGHISLIPTGGVTVENAVAMIDAGAVAVGISSGLFPVEAIANQQWQLIGDRTEALVKKLQEANSS